MCGIQKLIVFSLNVDVHCWNYVYLFIYLFIVLLCVRCVPVWDDFNGTI